MRSLNQGQWPPAWTTQLSGQSGIYEFRMEVNNIQYRPLFFFGPGRSQLTFVFVALEINDAFVPRDAPQRSDALRKDILDGRRQIREFQDA